VTFLARELHHDDAGDAPALQPFFVGDYKTYRCDVKYMQWEEKRS